MSDKTVVGQMREQWDNNAEWSILDEKVLVIHQDLLERWIKQIEEEKKERNDRGYAEGYEHGSLLTRVVNGLIR